MNGFKQETDVFGFVRSSFWLLCGCNMRMLVQEWTWETGWKSVVSTPAQMRVVAVMTEKNRWISCIFVWKLTDFG